MQQENKIGKFYLYPSLDKGNLFDFVVTQVLSLFRNGLLSKEKKLWIKTELETDSNILSNILWKKSGFIPNEKTNSTNAIHSPIVIGTEFNIGQFDFDYLINLNLLNTTYSEQEIKAKIIFDFTISNDEIITQKSRVRFKQLKSDRNIEFIKL